MDYWEKTSEKLAKWLMDLPKPIAIFASHDQYCLILSETCREYDIAVPEEIALLGVDNDELLCNRAYPPLSSVRTDVDLIGYETGKLLARMMKGEKPPTGEKLIAPLGIETRQSSDILAISDADVAAAVEFIKNHATRRITVRDVVSAAHVCRRVLERRFRRRLGRSILDEIHRVRIERAQELLVNTNMPVPEVAKAAGFRDGYHLWSTFRRKRGTSPASFRKRSQPR